MQLVCLRMVRKIDIKYENQRGYRSWIWSLTNPTKSVHDAPRANEYQSSQAPYNIPAINKKDAI
jgi:hypothetical protein